MANSDVAVQVWKQLIGLSHRLMRVGTGHLKQYDITPPQFFILDKLDEGEELIQQDLADRLMVSKGNISQMLKLMEQKGWIKRVPEGASNRILLTDKARELLAILRPAHDAFIHTILAGLSAQDQVQLLELLQQFEVSLE